jgi:ubiquitin-like 1-activating enzyme E1 B
MEIEDTKPAKLQKMVEIPRKPKSQPLAQPSLDTAASANGETGPEPAASTDSEAVTGKRKREGSSDLTNEHNAKRLANTSINEPIVLDDDDEGAILIGD